MRSSEEGEVSTGWRMLAAYREEVSMDLWVFREKEGHLVGANAQSGKEEAAAP